MTGETAGLLVQIYGPISQLTLKSHDPSSRHHPENYKELRIDFIPERKHSKTSSLSFYLALQTRGSIASALVTDVHLLDMAKGQRMLNVLVFLCLHCFRYLYSKKKCP